MKSQLLVTSICFVSLFSLNLSCKKQNIAPDSSTTTNVESALPLNGSRYKLISFEGKMVQDSISLFWDNQNKLSTKFCNNIVATVELKAGIVKGNALSTKMMCDIQALMTMEREFAQGLREGITLSLKANKIKPEKNDLYFTTTAGKTFIYEYQSNSKE